MMKHTKIFLSSNNRCSINQYRLVCFIMLMLALAVSVLSTSTGNRQYPNITLPTPTGPVPTSHVCSTCCSALTLSETDNSTVINGETVELSYFVRFEDCICGGTLIRHNLVLTSALCADGCSNSYVYVGSSSIYDGERIKVKAKHIHPYFDSYTAQHDIAILQLDCSSRNYPLLPNYKTSDLKANSPVVIAGFGALEDGSVPTYLQAAGTLPFTNNHCKKTMVAATQTFNGKFQFCAGECIKTGAAASSYGDFGGPVILYNDILGTVSLVGVFSWHFDPAGTLPSMYVRVAAYSSFIKKIIKTYSSGSPKYCT